MKHKFSIWLWGAALLCLGLTACTGGGDATVTTPGVTTDPTGPVVTEAPTEPIGGTTAAPETETEALTNPDLSEIRVEYVYPAEQAGAKNDTVLYVK